jgi:excisionase family DNA binding protein
MMQTIFTPEEIADKLKTSRSTVYRWLRNGELKAFKAGKLWRITREALEEFLKTPIPWEEKEGE